MLTRRTWIAPYALAAVALIGMVVAVLSLGGGHASSSTGFGMGRPSIVALPGGELSGRFAVPAQYEESDVSWQVVDADDTTVEAGRGDTWHVTLPRVGTTFTLHAVIRGTDVRDSLRIDIVAADAVAGRDLVVTGTVLVDGGRAIQGEALPQGVALDATGGTVRFVATARLDTGLSGEVRLQGTKLQLRSERASGGRQKTVVELARDASRDEQLLVADVQHLDGVRYVEVETPDAVAMVKGTRFYVRLDDAGTKVAVDHGWVVVARRSILETAPVDVRSDQSTVVPIVDPDEEAAAATPGAPGPRLVVRREPDFDAAVDGHFVRLREDLAQSGSVEESAPPPTSTQETAGTSAGDALLRPIDSTAPPTRTSGAQPPTGTTTAPLPGKPCTRCSSSQRGDGTVMPSPTSTTGTVKTPTSDGTTTPTSSGDDSSASTGTSTVEPTKGSTSGEPAPSDDATDTKPESASDDSSTEQPPTSNTIGACTALGCTTTSNDPVRPSAGSSITGTTTVKATVDA